LRDETYINECRTSITKVKQTLRAALPKQITMAETLDSCAICLLTHEDESADLPALLLEKGLRATPGAVFDGLGANSARLRLPHIDDCDRLCGIIRSL
jgi:hypothetical protein